MSDETGSLDSRDDKIEKKLDKKRPRHVRGQTEVPREFPKGVRPIKIGPEESSFEFRAVIRFWWLLPPILLVFTFSAAAPLGAGFGFLISDFYNDYTSSTAAVFFFVSLGATILSYNLTRPWVRVYVTPDRIRVGPQLYDRKHFGGMRIGYEINTDDGVLKNDFHDLSLGLQGVRLVYGPWGEDLIYLINKYHAAEIILWMNLIIDSVGEPDSRKTAPSIGRREQAF